MLDDCRRKATPPAVLGNNGTRVAVVAADFIAYEIAKQGIRGDQRGQQSHDEFKASQ